MAYVRSNLVAFISNNLFTFLIMKKRIIITWIILLLFTVAVGVISTMDLSFATVAILLLSSLKFIGVTFYFMELKKAHIFWRSSIITFLVLFSVIILVII